MGTMSDLDILARSVREHMDTQGSDAPTAIQTVAANTTYRKADIAWAYSELYE